MARKVINARLTHTKRLGLNHVGYYAMIGIYTDSQNLMFELRRDLHVEITPGLIKGDELYNHRRATSAF